MPNGGRGAWDSGNASSMEELDELDELDESQELEELGGSFRSSPMSPGLSMASAPRPVATVSKAQRTSVDVRICSIFSSQKGSVRTAVGFGSKPTAGRLRLGMP